MHYKKDIISKMSQIFDFVVYSNIYISLGAAALAYILFKIVGRPLDYFILSIPFITAFAIYNFNRMTDVTEDDIDDQKKSSFNKKYNKYLISFGMVAYFLIVIFSLMRGVIYGAIVLIPFAIGLLYSEKFFPSLSGKIRLKDVFLLKNLIVTMIWVYSTIIVPSFFLNIPLTSEIYFFCILVFFRILINNIFFDIKDIKGDSKVGVKTMPVVYGTEVTSNILIFTNGIITCAMLLIYWMNIFGPLLPILGIFGGIYGFIYLFMHRRNSMEVNKLSNVVADGEYILLGVFAYLLTSL